MAGSPTVNEQELHALSEFRCELRRFLRTSEELCKAEGVTPLQYQMLLQTRAHPGRAWILVGELAGRLHSAPHGAVALVSRAEAAGLVVRKADPTDGRQVQVHATARGDRILKRIAARHRHELSALSKVISDVRLPRH
jgi:DNA-binding MarR family transcriptional regulator